MAEIKGAEILAVGTWNDTHISSDDLDSIVSSFKTLDLKGRVPLKIGHDADHRRDDVPAFGWIERVYRKGDKLLADFASIPEKLYDAIKQGLYKFVSVEILANVRAGTQVIPWVLDAVAILGATKPAVGILKDLQSLTLSRLAYTGGVRFSFSLNRNSLEEQSDMTSEVEKLTKLLIAEKFNSAILAGRIDPAIRTKFFKRYGDAATLEEAVLEIECAPRPTHMTAKQPRAAVTHSGIGTANDGERSDRAVARLSREYIRANRDEFTGMQDYEKLIKAIDIVLSEPANKELAERYKLFSDCDEL